MTVGLLILGLLALVPIALIDFAFLTEVLLGLVPGRVAPGADLGRPRIAVLIPAHNEERSLPATVGPLSPLLGNFLRCVVVADNCTDGTAEVARGLGCAVVERRDPLRRGKGYALAAGRDSLAADPPDVVIIVDADCSISAEGLMRLARRATATGRAVQAAYMFRFQPLATQRVQISNFAFAVKNLIRQRGGRRIGAAAILSGSGMAFPWSVLDRLELATGNVVEDLALGIDLVWLGEPPLFEEHAVVWSEASSEPGTADQRARWEGGFLATARRQALRLIAAGFRTRRFTLLWMGIHLIILPLALLISANLLLFLGLALLVAAGAPVHLLTASAVLLGLLATAVLAAWLVEGRRHLSAGAFFRLPLYLLWKAKLYLGRAIGPEQANWVRTERKGEGHSPVDEIAVAKPPGDVALIEVSAADAPAPEPMRYQQAS